jgi:putative ABC transport system permease protein
VCLLIGLFIKDELSYDRHHTDAGRIFRVVKDFGSNDGSRIPDATTPPAIGPAMQKEIPDIEHVARLMPGWGAKFYVRAGEKRFIEENIYRADSSIFDVLTFRFVQGNAKTALESLDNIVLTESSAKKYFGNENPMGKQLEIDNRQPAIVSAVIKDIPANAHFHFDFLTPLRFRRANGTIADFSSSWDRSIYYTYIKLRPGASIASVDNKIRDIYKRNQPESKNYFYSQALTDIHLHSNLKWELSPNSDKVYIYIFGTIALFVLIIACINYINLTTARSSLRAKEIGIRKVSGAVRTSLIKQFLTESLLTALLAAALAVLLAFILLPAVNTITGKQLSINYFPVALVSAFALLIGFIAGFYPALYLSRFEPVKVLKGERLSRVRGFSLRKVLVVTQFSISIALIIGSITVMQQIKFIQGSKLGLDKGQVIMINDVGFLDRSQRNFLKSELQQIPGVKKLAFTSGIVGEQYFTSGMRLKGSKNDQVINFMTIDQDYLAVLNMQLKEGRNFSESFPADTISNGTAGTTERHAGGIILNEAAVKQLGITYPAIGKQLVYREQNDTTWYVEVTGVVKDFHFASMRNEIKPFAFLMDNNRQFYFTVKLDGSNMSSSIKKIQATWNKRVTSRPFQYFFLDETYAKLYAAEQNFKIIFFYITAIAIFISCLGLFGLSSFITQQRTKEIGIRKVLGASVSTIVGMLSKDFVKLVVIAAIIAFPVAWYAMNAWLQDFVYRIQIGWWVFAVAGLIALLIALATISFQAIRSALANPVRSLRTE